MKEKRKFIRLRAPVGIVYKVVRKQRRGRENSSLSKDVSGGGVRMLVKEELRIGDLLEMEIQLPLLADPIEAMGEVAWFDSFEAGIRFREIHPADLHKILEFVHTVGIG